MMKRLTDIWVNFTNDTERCIPEYFEWRKDDEVEMFDTVPLVLLQPKLYTYIEQGFEDIPQGLLDYVGERAFFQNEEMRTRANYAMVITDGVGVLAVFTDGEKSPKFKSRLLPRQERQALRIASAMVKFEIEWDPITKVVHPSTSYLEKFADIKAESMVGLTRRERELKEILLDSVFSLACSSNREEVKYWYIELFPKEYGSLVLEHMKTENMVHQIFDFLNKGWSAQHEEFGASIVKHFSTDDMWNHVKNKEVVN